jgi:diketogulonate reductase-like aldo/keto reductase
LTANSKEGKTGKDAVLSPEVATVARKYDVTPQVLFYRWVMSDGITCPLNGTSSQEHMKEDLEAYKIPLLDNDRDIVSEVVYRDL